MQLDEQNAHLGRISRIRVLAAMHVTSFGHVSSQRRLRADTSELGLAALLDNGAMLDLVKSK
jgi:predicted ABC-class ATPase